MQGAIHIPKTVRIPFDPRDGIENIVNIFIVYMPALASRMVLSILAAIVYQTDGKRHPIMVRGRQPRHDRHLAGKVVDVYVSRAAGACRRVAPVAFDSRHIPIDKSYLGGVLGV